jgi:predicted acylesterase/phospholipase RssA
MPLRQRFRVIRPLEVLDGAVVRAAMRDPNALDPRVEAALRTALSVARLYRLQGTSGDVDLESFVAPLRDEVHKLFAVGGFSSGRLGSPEKLRPIATILRDQALRARDKILAAHASELAPASLDREIREKSLVVAAGGGGGTGYVYLGVYALLEEHGFRPALIAGTSIGAVLGLFRARMERLDVVQILSIVRSLSWGKLFRPFSTESRYGLPAALRLDLRAAIVEHFLGPSGAPLRLKDLGVPFLATVTGIRRGALPRPLDYYQRLIDFPERALSHPLAFRRGVSRVLSAVGELAQREGMLEKVYLGLDAETAEFDAVDAVGFSSSLPGVLHYDVWRDDPAMHGRLAALFAQRDLFRLVDGGLVDNVPAQAAWTAVHQGRIGTRNVFVLALDGFAPKLSSPMWLPVQSLVAPQVARSAEYAHLYLPFRRTLSPLELIPSVSSALKALERGKEELAPEMPFIARMLRPLPPLP